MPNNLLHGWDDEKVYFYDDCTGVDCCITDEPDLYGALVGLCERYYRAKVAGGLKMQREPRRKRSNEVRRKSRRRV